MFFLRGSLFALPEVCDEGDEILAEAIKRVHDDNVLFVAGDFPDNVILSGEEAVAIDANYGQVRQY